MKISIFGLGYVGAVSLGCLARDGHEVTGVDIDQVKLDLITEGQTPIIEEGMADLMSSVAMSGLVNVTQDVDEAISNSEISFICVGTPSAANGSQNQSALVRLSEQLGTAIANKNDYHVFVLRSTVTPGTLEDAMRPIIEEKSGKKDGVDFDLCFQPEFLREGSSIKDYDKPPFTVIGSNSDRASAKVRDLFGHLPCEFHVCSIKTAEMLKFCCNDFHALKITFANEVGRLSQSLGVDPHEVMGLICKDTQLNISSVYLKPGFSFGGSCLPKDLRATVHMAKMRDVEIPMLAGILESNKIHTEHAINEVLETGKRNVGIIGLSFKSGTDDLRESPMVTITEQFIGKGVELAIYDPEVNLSRLLGANKRYINESIPHIGEVMVDDCEELIRNCEVLVVGLNDKALVDLIHRTVRPEQIVLDLVNIPEHETLDCDYRGICW
ncbi:MAG: nucleotide sugar dehydrogenase [Methylococcaceae bacterium]